MHDSHRVGGMSAVHERLHIHNKTMTHPQQNDDEPLQYDDRKWFLEWFLDRSMEATVRLGKAKSLFHRPKPISAVTCCVLHSHGQ